MKIVMTLLVHNEQDTLEANLAFHLAQGVDFVLVTDHGSTDGTPEILREWEERGVLRVFREDGPEHHQSRRVTRMARLAAAEYDADWVINNDGDEFWWPAIGTIADVLGAIPERYGQVIAGRNNFLPPVHGDDDRPFYERQVLRERRSQDFKGGLPLEPKVAHRASDKVTVAPGNHSISGVDLEPVPSLGLLEVMHFPFRSERQFESKILATGIGYESLTQRSPGTGQDQLTLLELQREGRLADYYAAQVLSDEAIASGLAAGELVVDRRFTRFMAELELARLARGYHAAPIAPDSDTARALIAAALGHPASSRMTRPEA